MSEETDNFLAHYGVKGMKWGVRRGSFASRKQGAKEDFNQRMRSANARMQKGRGSMTTSEKIALAPARILMGKKAYHDAVERGGQDWAAQAERIASGRTTVNDKINFAMNISLVDLFVSVTEYEK